jgi:hypothetical protein
LRHFIGALAPEKIAEQAEREKSVNDAGSNGIYKDFEYDSNGHVRPYPAGAGR